MKKQYILPSTTTVAFKAGFICNVGSSGTGINIGGGTLGGGGETPGNIDPM